MIEDTDESPVLCVVCSTSVDRDDALVTSYDDTVCADCVQVCQRCDDIGSVNDPFHLVDDNYTWCDPCTENRAHWCECCETYNSNGSYYIQDRGHNWCTECTESNTVWCEWCDTYYADGCDSCDSEDTDSNGNRIIHDYSYRPDAIFHSTDKNERLYFGIEIEVEDAKNLSESSNYAHRLEGMELAYLKHDGSLSCGYEIVTHPMSHDYFKNEAGELWDTLEKLRTHYNVKSWDTSTCGLHIHVSRSGFNGGSHMHRFLNLIYSNQEFYQRLAGREQSRWATFDDIMLHTVKRDEYGSREVDEDGNSVYETTRSIASKLKSNSTERYSAVNTRNRDTLEIRIFRGTVNTNTIKSHIDLAHASVEYTRTLTVKDVRNGALSADRFMLYIIQNSELYPELHERINRIILPNYVRLNGQRVSN